MIYIIRHGETDANAQGLLQGQVDFSLNENGVLLAELTGKGMADIKFDFAYSSPLKRAKETARLVLDNSGNNDVVVKEDERIQEICFGEWEGKMFKGSKCELPADQVALMFSNPFAFDRAPKGESFRELCIRTQDFLKELASCKNLENKNILVATHGCALRSMLNFLYDDKEDFWHGHVPLNCVVNIVDTANGQCRLTEEDKIYYDKKYVVDRYEMK